MAKTNVIKELLQARFTDCTGAPSINAFADYFDVVLYNDRSTQENALTCKDRSLTGVVYIAVLNEFNALFEYHDIATAPATSPQFKKALTDFFGVDYTQVLKPIIDFFKIEREERKKE